MRRIIFLILFLLIAAGGYFGYMQFAKGVSPKAVIAKLKNGGTDVPAVAEKAPDPKPVDTDDVVFLKMPTLTVSMFNRGDITQALGIEITLEFKDDDEKAKAQTMLPKLKDSILVRLYQLSRLDMLPTEGSAVFLKNNILNVAQTVLKTDQITAVMVYTREYEI